MFRYEIAVNVENEFLSNDVSRIAMSGVDHLGLNRIPRGDLREPSDVARSMALLLEHFDFLIGVPNALAVPLDNFFAHTALPRAFRESRESSLIFPFLFV